MNPAQRAKLGKLLLAVLAASMASAAGCAFAAERSPAGHMPAEHWIGPRITPQEYLESNAGLYVLDKDGILVTLYRDKAGQKEPRREYNPAFIANYAITACRTYVAKGNPADLQVAQKQLDWLAAHGTPLRRGGVTALMYPYSFEWVKFGLKAPWVSAFAQSLVGVAFACGSDATGSTKYLAAARGAFNALRIPVKNGGVTTFGGSSAWFEEAAARGFPSIKVLNGHLTAAQGLKNFIDWHPDARFAKLWKQHVNAVEQQLPRYDAGYMSYYAQYPAGKPGEWEPSGRKGYNAVHVIQLVDLYAATGRPAFLDYALKFAQYETPDLTITTAGSTAADTNGPDRINMVMGNDYWSHGVFPTWVNVDMGAAFDVSGMYIIAHTDGSAPRAYTIEYSLDGSKYQRLLQRTDNSQSRIAEHWNAVRARHLRIAIQSDNGNQNAALKGVYPVRRQPYGAAVAASDSMSVGNMPALALGRGGWSAPASGWLVFRRDALPQGVTAVEFGSAQAGTVSIAGATTTAGLPHAKRTTLACADGRCNFDLTEAVSPNEAVVRVEWRLQKGSGPLKLRLR